MLYATTRGKGDVETAYRAIHLDCAADGGLFVPFRLPQLNHLQIRALAGQSFGQNIADILNRFFSCGLSGWDIEFSIGRSPVRVASITHRILIAEAWHNSKWEFDSVIQTLSDRIRKEGMGGAPTNWMRIAVRIAALFGIYGLLLSADQTDARVPLDLAVTTGDFEAPMAAWYAREMGLPIGNIICGCNANGGVWDLLHRGEMATGGIAVRTSTPNADIAVPRDLERLVSGALSPEDAAEYVECCRKGAVYAPAAGKFDALRRGMFAAVISDSRVSSIIHSVYRTSGYVFSPYAALAYGSLLDYRAQTGESRTAMLLCERGPVCDSQQVADALKVPVPELLRRIHIS